MQTYTSGGKLLYGINIYLEHTINAKDGLIKYNITTSLYIANERLFKYFGNLWEVYAFNKYICNLYIHFQIRSKFYQFHRYNVQ